jgi:hypothetical protein
LDRLQERRGSILDWSWHNPTTDLWGLGQGRSPRLLTTCERAGRAGEWRRKERNAEVRRKERVRGIRRTRIGKKGSESEPIPSRLLVRLPLWQQIGGAELVKRGAEAAWQT